MEDGSADAHILSVAAVGAPDEDAVREDLHAIAQRLCREGEAVREGTRQGVVNKTVGLA